MTKTLGIRLSGIALALAGAFAAYTQQGKQAPVAFNLVKVADDIYDIDGGGAGNVGVYVTDEGAIVIDDKFEQHFDEIMANVKKVTDKPVKYVINTHHHSDHSGGNPKMLASGAEILLHKNARANMVKGKQAGVPRIAFADEAQVVLGGKEVIAHHYGRGHTNGDAVIYFPARRVIHTGDLMANSALIDYANGGSLAEWAATLDQVLKLDFDKVIPGHGPVSDKAGLKAWRDKVAAQADAAKAQIRSGKSKDDVMAFMTANYGWGAMNKQMSLDGLFAEMK